ncbi:MAG: phosphatase PAP2 family protein [Eubacteriales bacterium]|nr:phosphatase PAP2 family protein [Eubacteriales bacterium]
MNTNQNRLTSEKSLSSQRTLRNKIMVLLKTNREILLLPLFALALNTIVYSCGRALASGRFHYDMTLPLDERIPLVPWTMLIYWGCFIFWTFSYLWFASRDRKNAGHFFLMFLIGEVVCLWFFIFLPTTNVRPEITGTDFWSRSVIFLYQVDEANNLFPSIHCMISWMCWIELRRQAPIFQRQTRPEKAPSWLPRFRRWAFVWAIAVFISTLTLKQHVLVDIFAAIAVSEIANRMAEISILQEHFLKCIEKIIRKKI